LFFALLLVCASRGLSLHAYAWWQRSQKAPLPGKVSPELQATVQSAP
jgi:hypothetical protein